MKLRREVVDVAQRRRDRFSGAAMGAALGTLVVVGFFAMARFAAMLRPAPYVPSSTLGIHWKSPFCEVGDYATYISPNGEITCVSAWRVGETRWTYPTP